MKLVSKILHLRPCACTVWTDIPHVAHGAQSNKKIHFLLKIVRVDRGTQEHLLSALRVADIGQFFLTCGLKNMIDEGWKIFETHIFLTKVPIFCLFRAERCMIVTKSCATIVSEPNVITLVGKDERWGILGIVSGPEIHVTHETSHHEDYRLLSRWITSLAWYPIDLADISILSDHSVRFRCVTIFITCLNEVCMAIISCISKGGQSQQNTSSK